MPPRLPAVISLLILLISPALSLSSSTTNTTFKPECATSGSGSFNPSAAFTSTVQSTISEIQNLISTVQSFPPVFGNNLRLTSAISDCLDLLDLSASELSLTLSNLTAASHLGTGNRRSDLKSWLSAALGNQDTCQESLSGASSVLASLVGSGLDSVTQSVAQTLAQIGPGSGSGPVKGFPKWVSGSDQRLLQVGNGGMAASANVVVAADGSGNYRTVSEAVEKAPAESYGRFVIYVKKGVYKENVEIKKKKWNVMIVGDGVDQTVISGSRNVIDGWTTYRSATLAVSGKGFIARDLTVENTAGPSKHQAVALRSDSDLSVYYRCSFRGYQDTLYVHSLRQFYRECIIIGTVDFIFGNAAAIFQNSQILARLPLPDQKNSVTAQGRKDPNQNTGFALQFCNITADSTLVGSVNQSYTYLGRPWKEFSRTIVMQSYIGNAIRPEGWLAWQDNFALDTLYYAEYMNYGPGSSLGNRVKWTGYHAINSSTQAANFTVAQFIDGNLWLPSTGVKYTAGLMV